jgi:hypothetical protein
MGVTSFSYELACPTTPLRGHVRTVCLRGSQNRHNRDLQRNSTLALKNKEYQARILWDVGKGDICDLANGKFAARQAARHGETHARQDSAEHDLTHAD